MVSGAGAVLKRDAGMQAGHGNGEMAQLPGWAVIVIFADFLVFFPVFIYIVYTFNCIYPTLAIVEDPQPPAYTALTLTDDGLAAENTTAKADDAALTTSSIRRIDALLRSTAGWTANFRGMAAATVLNMVCVFIAGAVSWAVPHQLGLLIAMLATVQLSAAWTHIVITTPSSLPFWKRLPAFGKTFKASWLPTVVYWAATEVTMGLPTLLARAFGLSQWDPSRPTAVPAYNGHAIWQSLLVITAGIAAVVLLMIPAEVVLVRVQASLLPADADTIVPFDRSFGGAIEPEVVTGRGYVDIKTAWVQFERASWFRLYRLLAKITAITFAVYIIFLAIVVPEYLLMVKISEPAGSL